jgi:periplasmic copper chaperone A
MKQLFAAAALALFAFPALAADLTVSGAFLRASPKVANAGAGFLTISNSGKTDDKLIGASADVSKTVELHTHIKDGEIMRMRQVQSIAVPAGGAAQLKPGGDHVMFIDLKGPLMEGDKVPVTLVFEKAGKIDVVMPVLGVGAMAAPAAMDHMQHMMGK